MDPPPPSDCAYAGSAIETAPIINVVKMLFSNIYLLLCICVLNGPVGVRSWLRQLLLRSAVQEKSSILSVVPVRNCRPSPRALGACRISGSGRQERAGQGRGHLR